MIDEETGIKTLKFTSYVCAVLCVIVMILIPLFIEQVEAHPQSCDVDTDVLTSPSSLDPIQLEIISKCTEMNLTATAKCLISNTYPFFKYNLTEDSLNLTFQDLHDKGGDCRNWAFYYEGMAKELGFYSYTTRISTSNSSAHRYAIMSSKIGEGYCILDQLSSRCIQLR